jgi:hypothetical protein
LLRALTLAFVTGSALINFGAPARTQSDRPFINVANMILAEPAVETPLPIQIGPADAVPQQTFLRIRGLPKTATLSEGHAIAAGSWAIPLVALSRLRIAAPIGSEGKSDITISLVAIDGTVLSEVKTTLLVTPTSSVPPEQQDQMMQAPENKAVRIAEEALQVSQRSQAAQGAAANIAALRPPATTQPTPTPRLQLEPAPPTAAPQLKPEDRERASKFVQKGDENLRAGHITAARLFYQRAAEIGWGPGALALAATYDPNELSRWKVVGGVQADVATARKWYEKARDLGASEAADRLRRLGAR